jgi:hypothetical protein
MDSTDTLYMIDTDICVVARKWSGTISEHMEEASCNLPSWVPFKEIREDKQGGHRSVTSTGWKHVQKRT